MRIAPPARVAALSLLQQLMPSVPKAPPTPQQRLRRHDSDWIALVGTWGLRVSRGDTSWVWYDGAGTIGVAPDDQLDDDDFLGQILLHEICHLAVQGNAARALPDWGLDNLTDTHREHEHAALRLQAWLSDRVGLREVFVATTDFRPYYLALPKAPLVPTPARWPEDSGSPVAERDVARATSLAEAGLARLQQWGWLPALALRLQEAARLLSDQPETMA